jgi:hypothetical protein
MSREVSEAKNGNRLHVVDGGRQIPPLPYDAPLLSMEDCAAYMRTTVGAIRKEIEAGTGPLAETLRANLVALSERRRFIRARPFREWLGKLASWDVKVNDTIPDENAPGRKVK